jgi:hypothetical protein
MQTHITDTTVQLLPSQHVKVNRPYTYSYVLFNEFVGWYVKITEFVGWYVKITE